MEKKLSNNLGLKVLSVFLAFFVWLAVVNINNPEDSDSKEVPLDVVNEGILTSNGKTYELLTDKDTVTVSYRVRTLDKAGISASDFRAYIDLADIYEPTGAVPVKIEVKNNKRLLDTPVAKPGVIRVKTEDLQRKSFEIRAKVIGEAAEGYDIGTPSVCAKLYQCQRSHVCGGPDQRCGNCDQRGRRRLQPGRQRSCSVL